jgi:ParB-like chromosome segregation protein Spo0J
MRTQSPDDFHNLIGRAMDDVTFRAMLINPDQRAQALRQVGIENPTKDQLAAIAAALEAIGRAADTFGVMKAAM